MDKELQLKNKHSRNLGLINQGLELDPDSPALRYALGAEYYQQGQYDVASDILLPLLNSFPAGSGFTSDIYLKTAFALHGSGRLEEAEAVFTAGIALFPDFTELSENYALLLSEQGYDRKAYAYLLRALQCGDASSKYTSSSGSGTYRTSLLAGEVCEKLFLFREAAAHYEDAIYFHVNYSAAWKELVPLRLLAGEADRLISLTRSHIDALDPNTLNILVPAALNARSPEWLTILCGAPSLPLPVRELLQVLLIIIYEQEPPSSAAGQHHSLQNGLPPHSHYQLSLEYLWALSCREGDEGSAKRWVSRITISSCQPIPAKTSPYPAAFPGLC
ncbi:hypothetical protein PaeBR_06675 [Paenibacillus sp. BR2-3]|uniref:tetratricopeptide repeat protein n=1 Tax=Paenibacillus sp. BR2-3 TaxID=3048494 RepID=UPI0039775081